MKNTYTVVIPAKDEEQGLSSLLPELKTHYPDFQIIVVDDGSKDNTKEICFKNGIKVISHKYSKGNGAAIKTGGRNALHDSIIFMDADGQHHASSIKLLIDKYEDGYDMVVGARSKKGQANMWRSLANRAYNLIASLVVNQEVKDLTSGFRIVEREKFLSFLHLLPNGFSYPTTITMAFFRAGYNVGYTPIPVDKRVGKSHIKLFKDGVRFLLIIFKIATLYSPLKIFVPISFFFFSTGALYYLYTFIEYGRFTNMSALLFSTSVLIFLMGLVSEQITSLIYSKNEN